MARRKIKFNNPDGLFIQHSDQIKHLFKKNNNKNIKKEIKCNITHGFFYFLNIYNQQVILEFVSKLEKINIIKIIENICTIIGSSDKLYLPDISIRLNNEIENIIELLKNHKNLFSNEKLNIQANKSIGKTNIKVPEAKLFNNLSIILNQLYHNIQKILNENFILELNNYSLDTNSLITTHKEKQDKNEALTIIKINIYLKNNLNSCIYNKILIIPKNTSDITKEDIFTHELITEIKELIKDFPTKKYLYIKKDIQKNIDGILFDTTASSYIMQELKQLNSFKIDFADIDNFYKAKENNISCKKEVIKSKKQGNKSQNIYQFIFDYIQKTHDIKNLIYIIGVNTNDINFSLNEDIFKNLNLIPFKAFLIKKNELHPIKIEMLELSKDTQNCYLYNFNTGLKQFLFYEKDLIINIMYGSNR